MIINTKEKDRQTQIKIIFALMSILCGDEWFSIDQLVKELKKKGFSRCERTVRRLLRTLKDLNFNLMCKTNEGKHKYKGNKKRIFIHF